MNTQEILAHSGRSSPSDEVDFGWFPVGFAEQPGPRPMLQIEIPDGEIYDVGFNDYGEFFANLRYGWELMNGGMTSVDGRPGKLRVANRYLNAIQLKWVFDDLDVVGTPESICPWGEL